MTVIKNAIFPVMERFPGTADTIKRLFSESEDFQSLCEDYRRCSEALRHWDKSAEEDAPARRQEYQALLRELEEEIEQNLNEFA